MNRTLKSMAIAAAAIVMAAGCQRDATDERAAAEFKPHVVQHAYQPNELLVKYREGQAPATDRSAKRFESSAQSESSGMARWHHVVLPAGTDVKAAMKEYRQDPRVEYVEPNYRLTKSAVPDDPSFFLQWGLLNTGSEGGVPGADIRAPLAWDISTGSSAVVVAVTDTGVDITHPDLSSNIWVNADEIPGNGIDDDANGYVDDANGYDFAYRDNTPNDVDTHGTHVAGIIAARGNNTIGGSGVAWNARIMPLKFLDDTGSGTTAGAIEAVTYAVQNGANIINASWGNYSQSLALRDAISAANDAGVLFVASAGNDTNDNDLTPHYPSGFDLPNVISVAATDRFDARADSSNFGRNTVDLGAPGAQIFSTSPNSDYRYRSGTSTAAPHVSGAAALLLAQSPGMTVTGLKSLLMDRGKQLPAMRNVTASGRRLDVHAALQCDANDRVLNVRAPVDGFALLEGESAVVSAHVTSCGTLLPEYQMSASFSNGDATIQLLDDGLHADGAAGDGVFANYWDAHVLGPVTVTVTADAPSQSTLTQALLGAVRPRVRYQHEPVPLAWIDATAGTAHALGDDGSITIPVDFPFSFYGLPQTAVTINANGLLTFGSSLPATDNQYLPSPAAPNNLIAAFWDDLNVGSGSVYSLLDGVEPNRRLTIAWIGVGRNGVSGDVTFEVTLHEGANDIVMAYQDTAFGNVTYDKGANAMAGLEDLDGLDATPLSQRQPLVESGAAHRFYVVPSEPDLTYRVTVTTSLLRSTSGKLVMSVVDGDTNNNNYFNILRFATNGDVILAPALQGDASGSLIPGPAYVGDASFANVITQPIIFGTQMSFLLRVSRLGDFQPYPDSFAFYLLNSSDDPYPTSDPLGTDALFAVEVDRPQPLPLVFESDYATVLIETVGAPVASPGGPYFATVSAPIAFDGSGSLDAEGEPLGYQWDFGDGSTGTGASPTHSYASSGIYTVTLIVNDGALYSAPATTTATIGVSEPPIANAGADQTANQNVPVTLSAAGSSDPDGTIASYAWRQIAGPGVALANANTATASFTSPVVSGAKVLTFELTVRDNNGDIGKDTVNVTVLKNNIPPTANAGADQTVDEGAAIVLDGRGSSDLDGTIDQWQWSQISGPAAAEMGGTTPGLLDVTTPSVQATSVMTFRLTITDSRGATASDTVTVTVRNIDNPVANAGVDQTVNERANVSLSGSATDPDGGTIVSYSWVQIAGFAVTLNNANTATPTFTAPSVSADHVMRFRLTVTDNAGLTGIDTVDINVRNVVVPPTAVAGPDQTVDGNTTVYLDAQASSDPDGFITAATWTETAGPAVVLNNANTLLANFTAPIVSVDTVLTFQVAITDDDQVTSTDSVRITVRRTNTPPTANAGPDQTVNERTTVTLDGTGSFDAQGPVTYQWNQIAGPLQSFNPLAARPTFTAPSVLANTTLRFQLQVTDSDGVQSNIDTVDVTVLDIDMPPTANAGPDQSVLEGATVQLSGSGTDPDGTIASYQWSVVSGPAVTINNATSPNASFVAPQVASTTVITLRLLVTDNSGFTGTDTVSITVLDRDTDGDGDGLGDGWEIQYFGSTTAQNGSGDPDGDGITNLQEFQSDSNPTVADGIPPAVGQVSARAGDTDVIVTFSKSPAATRYDLYWGTSPTVSVATGTKIANVTSPYTHSGRTNGTTYYYIVVAGNLHGDSAASTVVSALPGPRRWSTTPQPLSLASGAFLGLADLVRNNAGDAMLGYYADSGSSEKLYSQRYSAASGWGAPLLIATMPNFQNEFFTQRHLAMNARGDAVTIWMQDDGFRFNVWSSYLPAGASAWQAPVLVENDTAAAEQVAAVSIGDNGLIAAIWVQNGTTYGSVRMPPGSWAAKRALGTVAGSQGNQVAVSADPTGGALFAWIGSGGVVQGARYAGGAWQASTTLHASIGTATPTIKAGTDTSGNGVVAFTATGTRGRYDIYASKFRAATGWDASPTVIDGATAVVQGLRLIVKPDGRAVAAWGQSVLYGNLMSATGTWSGARTLSKSGAPLGLATDSQGRGFAVFATTFKGTSTFKYSTLSAAAWSTASSLATSTSTIFLLAGDDVGDVIGIWTATGQTLSSTYLVNNP